MSSNILPKEFSLLDDAINSINQVKKSFITFQDKSGKWKVLVLNEKEKVYSDLESFDVPDDDCFIIINDNFGNIKRKKVQLTYDDTSFLTKVFSEFKINEYFLNEKNNILEYLNSLLKKEKVETFSNKSLIKSDLLPESIYCYFKSFIPSNITIEPIVNNENIEKLFLYIKIIDKKHINILEPLFRRNKTDIEEVNNLFNSNNSLSIKLELKEKILLLIENDIKQKGIMNCMSILNPLGKGVINNLINYDIVDIY